ncbi:tyrosine-type recombinase/integrase [Sulfuricurvum sp.]|uniref:tyrosine-type recombinase/integrase n=1 Tax=Sulfuricurvum sp. TaxID=2025608 RepID=UPI00356235C4
MARKAIPLTDTEIKKAKPTDKDYKLFDGGGLFMLVKTNGGKLWRLKYNFEGKEKLLSLGTYPTTSLLEARAKRDEHKKDIAKGIDPSAERKEIKTNIEVQKIENEALKSGQFHLITYGWLDTLTNDETTMTKRRRAFERDIFPYLCEYDKQHVIVSSKHIGSITHGELLRIINEKEKTAAETARRLFTDCNRLWLYAISHGHASFNITTNISKKDALKKQVKNHYAKITDEKILGELLRALDSYSGIIIRNALRFTSIIPLRAENLSELKWSYIDLDKATLTIPRSKMKVKDKKLPDFILPLPRQAIAILQEIKELTGWGEWVFHGISKPLVHMDKESPNKALRSMGFNDEINGRKQTIHSFRGTYRSLCETYAREHGASFEVMEKVLDHQEANQAVRAYTHKADYTEQMRELLQWWADFLDTTKGMK